MTTKDTQYFAPEWARHVVWYQLFPERFCNGDPNNDPTAERVLGKRAPEHWEISPWTGDWYERAPWEKELGPSFRDGIFHRRYGGDLQGIIDKLDYLQELGIGAIYLNPVFDAVSLHKYDTSHYRHVDRFFGPDPEGDAQIIEAEDPQDPSTWQWTAADRLFLQLIEEVHDRGMKIIIDAVFNHTGRDFWAFRDLHEHQQESRFKDWYDVITYRDEGNGVDFDYESWWGVKDLPELRQENNTLAEPIRNHLKNITRRWMDPEGNGEIQKGVDGWRLDVPEEIEMPFWEEWCGFVRSINPDAFISGEIWDEKAFHWVKGGLFTCVMNYSFAKAVQGFMIDRNISAEDFSNWLHHVRTHFPDASNGVMQNLMDSHDTPRLASMLLNPGREYDTLGKPEEGFDVRKPTPGERAVQRLIALFQFTYLGAPMIYYGTEAGMWGADDPDNRKPMVWPELDYEPERSHPLDDAQRPEDENSFDHELFEWYKQLIGIRNAQEALQTGAYRELLVDSERNLLVFARFRSEGTPVIVGINRSDEEHEVAFSLEALPQVPASLTDALTDETVAIENNAMRWTIEPVSGRLFL